MFDLVFMLQHYVLFRNPPNPESGYKKIEDDFSDDGGANDVGSMTPPPKVNDGDKSSPFSDEERPLLMSGKKKKKKKQLDKIKMTLMFWKTK